MKNKYISHKKWVEDYKVDQRNSVFDIFPTKEKPNTSSSKVLEIVGECPTCGAPVYGQKMVKQGESPVIQFSCQCRVGILARLSK